MRRFAIDEWHWRQPKCTLKINAAVLRGRKCASRQLSKLDSVKIPHFVQSSSRSPNKDQPHFRPVDSLRRKFTTPSVKQASNISWEFKLILCVQKCKNCKFKKKENKIYITFLDRSHGVSVLMLYKSRLCRKSPLQISTQLTS